MAFSKWPYFSGFKISIMPIFIKVIYSVDLNINCNFEKVAILNQSD